MKKQLLFLMAELRDELLRMTNKLKPQRLMKFKFYIQFIGLLFSVPLFSYGQTEEELINAYQTAHNLFVLNNGQVMSCGKNGYGQLGRPANSFEMTPDLVSVLTDVVSAKEGNEFSLALKRDGTVWSWGRNNRGQLGAAGSDRHTPQQVPGLSCVVEIATGPDYAMALLSDGTVKSWGYNGQYQLGYTTPGSLYSATPAVVPGVNQVKKIVCGWASSYAILANGAVMAWGRNTNGLLGRGNQTTRELPDIIPDLNNVKDINCGINHCIVLLTDQTIRVWGSSIEGQLGLGSSVTASFDPIPLATSTISNNVSKIAALRDGCLILLTDGSVMSWGENYNGEAIVCTAGINYTPVTVTTGLTGIIDLKGNGYNSLVILNGGSYRIYGENASGQLGQGNFDPNIHCSGNVPIGVPIIKTGRGLTFSDIADAGADISFCGQVPAVIQLGTSYCRNHIATYSWEPMIGLNSYTISNPRITSPQDLPFGPSTYTLTMTVDGVSTTDEVTVTRLPDMATGAKIGEDVVNVCSGTPTVINPLYEITGGAAPYIYKWTAFSAGAPISALSSTVVPNPTFTYNVEGTYTYKVTVSSAPGCETFYYQSIYVRKSAHTVADFPTNVFCDYNNTGASFITYNLPSYTYLWTIKNGYTSNTNTASPDFSSGGTYNITLVVTDPCGNSASVTKQVTFNPSTTNYNPSCCEASVTYTTGLNGNYTVNASNTVGGILTWNTSKIIRGIVYIENGYTLKIITPPSTPTTTIYFGMNGGIVVKPGGRLEVTNAIVGGLDNIVVGMTCKTMWQGIEVWGNETVSQTGFSQGVATLLNAQIINAHKAIFVGKRNQCYDMPGSPCSTNEQRNAPSFVKGFGGGVINVQNSTFTSNAVDIEFAPYANPEVPLSSNLSLIKGNTFSGGELLDPSYEYGSVQLPYPNINNQYYASANSAGRVSRHIKVYKISGLRIQDNVFDNAEYGIESFDSKLNITKVSALKGNDFKNLRYGIAAFHTSSPLTYGLTIAGNNFNKVKTAIRIDAGKYVTIKKNVFGDEGTSSTQSDNPKGVYLAGTSNFTIADNTFYRLDTTVQIYESGSIGGKITADQEGNTFIRCKQGVMTSYNNQSLQIRCNFNNNDEALTGEYISRNWEIAGALPTQGATGDHTKPAGNEFFPSNRKDIYSSTPFFYQRHAYAVDGVSLTVLPTVASGSTPGWNNDMILNTGYKKESNSCIPAPPCSPNCDEAIENNEVRRMQIETDYQSIFESLDAYGAATTTMLDMLGSNEYTSQQIRDVLLESSPLSDMVLSTLLDNYNKVTIQHLIEILTPNLPMNAEVWDQLSALFPIFSASDVTYLTSLQITPDDYTTLTQLEEEYQQAMENQQRFLEEVVEDELANETPEAAAIRLLEQDNENKQTAVSTYLAMGNALEATDAKSEVRNETSEDGAWHEMTQVYLDQLNSEVLTWFEMSNVHDGIVNDIEQSGPSIKAKLNAQAVRRLVYGEEYPMLEQDHSAWGMRRKTKPAISLLTKEDKMMPVYPNPAREQIHIPYYSSLHVEGGMRVVNLLGKEVASYSLEKGYNLITVSASGYKPGVYAVVMRDGNAKIISVQKITIQK